MLRQSAEPLADWTSPSGFASVVHAILPGSGLQIGFAGFDIVAFSGKGVDGAGAFAWGVRATHAGTRLWFRQIDVDRKRQSATERYEQPRDVVHK
ncbi:MAG: hypothetical protein AAGG57_19725 [Pseudomonadota bacterium]